MIGRKIVLIVKFLACNLNTYIRLIDLLNFGFSSPINVPTIDVLTNDTPFAIGTASDISKKKN